MCRVCAIVARHIRHVVFVFSVSSFCAPATPADCVSNPDWRYRAANGNVQAHDYKQHDCQSPSLITLKPNFFSLHFVCAAHSLVAPLFVLVCDFEFHTMHTTIAPLIQSLTRIFSSRPSRPPASALPLSICIFQIFVRRDESGLIDGATDFSLDVDTILAYTMATGARIVHRPTQPARN